MRKGAYFALLFIFLFTAQLIFAQTIVPLGDLPRSEYAINVYQVYGFQEGYEGYKIIYLDTNSQPQYLYLPAELRSNYRIYKPELSTHDQNFLIIWKKGDRVERIEWFMPRAINYDLPNFVIKPFGEKDKDIFQKIVDSGELVLGIETAVTAPEIRAPGGE